ncbi:hypothetical protein [Dokdonia sp. Hel_I_53]|uniref:hypothetical protein n=1 Tax=Dokdonia sp. Hel_I_53 TaxID=1566287 RepID=UPI00119A3461|nr:hypothetical protein [Dokdonia sp. Hel_I_53]TVZ53193.1 hypothetical protein OD90_2392 [Dokdonia sp. Hel_I_53]
MSPKVLEIILFLAAFPLLGQIVSIDSLVTKNGITKLNLASTHPLGIYSTQISQNFREHAVKKTQLILQQQSGNVFQPQVTAYLPEDPNIRQQFSSLPWFYRVFDYENQEETPAQLYSYEFDAVIKVYRATLLIPLAKKQDLHIGARGFMAVAGKNPWSIFSNDANIEWFHSNIAGGEDPFGRKFYGYDQVKFRYTDNRGRTLTMKRGEFFLGGIDATYNYYPANRGLSNKHIATNIGITAGWNTTRFNHSVDIGIQGAIQKKWPFRDHQFLRFATGINVQYNNVIDFKKNVSLGNNRIQGATEMSLEWTTYTNRGNFNALQIHYQLQTPFRKKEEKDYFHLKGDWESINAGWHNGYTTLLEYLSSWTLQYTHGRKKINYHVYLKEDLSVNNAPDIESGIGITYTVN